MGYVREPMAPGTWGEEPSWGCEWRWFSYFCWLVPSWGFTIETRKPSWTVMGARPITATGKWWWFSWRLLGSVNTTTIFLK